MTTLTFADVAARAGVGERTVYRYFPTHRALHEAVIEHMERTSGWSAEKLDADELADLPRRLFPLFERSGFAMTEPEPPALAENRSRRYARVHRAVTEVMPGAGEPETRAAAAVLQLLSSVDAFRRMRRFWDLDAEAAADAAAWAMQILIHHLRQGSEHDHEPRRRTAANNPDRSADA
jgi:AcrR family transcriptional regulator